MKIINDKSIYEPISMEIGGKKFTVVELSRAFFRKIRELEKRILVGEIEAAWEKLEVIFGGPDPILESQPFFKVAEISAYVLEKIINPDKLAEGEAGDGKKAKEPGETA